MNIKNNLIKIILSTTLALPTNDTPLRKIKNLNSEKNINISYNFNTKKQEKNYKNFNLFVDTYKINIDLYYQNSPKNIIILPTLGEPISSVKKFCKIFSKKGFNVFAMDLKGFGKSDGQRGVIDIDNYFKSIDKLTEKITKEYTSKIGILGSGFGGDIAGIYLLSKKNKIKSSILEGVLFPFEKKLVLKDINDKDIKYVIQHNDNLGPWLKYGDYIDILEKAKKTHETFYLNKSLNKQFQNPEYVTKIRLKEYLNFLRYPLNPDYSKLPPTLIIGLPNDTIIPLKHSKNLYEKIKKENSKCKFTTIKNSKLLILDEKPEEISNIAKDWFNKTLN